jgi:hypothetical protein
MVFNAIFNNISVLLVDKSRETPPTFRMSSNLGFNL